MTRVRVHPISYREIAPQPPRRIPWNDAGAFTDYAKIVKQTLGDSPLSYSNRQRLIALAALRGIGRFDANLIIAMVQQRTKVPPKIVKVKKSRASIITAICAMQSIILAAGWWLLH